MNEVIKKICEICRQKQNERNRTSRTKGGVNYYLYDISKMSYEIADAMIKARRIKND